MAKKSAKSKGYRRQTAKKPYLSTKEIAALCAIVAVLAVAAFFLFRYDDGALKVQNGAVVTDGDNWLVANGSNVRGGARYYKLGEIGEIDGYTRARGAQITDANLPQYTFTPDAEGDVTVTVSCGHGSAEAMAKYTRSLLEENGMTGVGEIQTADLSGREARWYSYATEPTGTAEAPAAEAAETGEAEAPAAEAAETGEAEAPAAEAAETGEAEAPAAEAAETGEAEAPAAEAAETGEAEAPADGGRYGRTLAGYVDASHDCCVIVSIVSRGDTGDDCLSDDALLAILEKTVGAVSLDK